MLKFIVLLLVAGRSRTFVVTREVGLVPLCDEEMGIVTTREEIRSADLSICRNFVMVGVAEVRIVSR